MNRIDGNGKESGIVHVAEGSKRRKLEPDGGPQQPAKEEDQYPVDYQQFLNGLDSIKNWMDQVVAARNDVKNKLLAEAERKKNLTLLVAQLEDELKTAKTSVKELETQIARLETQNISKDD